MELRRQSNCLYYCNYHLVLATKYRRKIFNDGVHEYMHACLREIGEYYPEITFLEINHDLDHVHILVSIPPKLSVGAVVRIIKLNTTRHLKEQFPFLLKVYYGKKGIWSDGYFVSTVGVNEDIIRRYIEHQGKEDFGQAQLEL
jgi:putative transposase